MCGDVNGVIVAGCDTGDRVPFPCLGQPRGEGWSPLWVHKQGKAPLRLFLGPSAGKGFLSFARGHGCAARVEIHLQRLPCALYSSENLEEESCSRAGRSSPAPLPGLMGFHAFERSQKRGWGAGESREEPGECYQQQGMLQPGRAEPVRVSIHGKAALRQPGHGAGPTCLMAGGQGKRHGT